jgi:dTDP-4-amino-4,6-dideoxygalactose transaminase
MFEQSYWRVRFNAPAIVGKEMEHIADAVSQGRLSGDGKYTRLCHAWLENTLGCESALLTHSGTSALEMAAMLFDLGPGDEVIMPSFTFVSTANAFVSRGATPVFVDISPDSLNIDVEQVSKAITESTKAIVPVHYGGLPCDMDFLLKLCESANLRLIEDAAHAMLSSIGENYLGSIGDVGCISFHETKNIISGEGGALLINDPKLVERARVLWEKGTNRNAFNQGQVDKYTWIDIGSSFLPGELTAAFLYGQLECASKIINRRLEICALYRSLLGDLGDKKIAILPPENSHGKNNGHLFYLMLENREKRNQLIEYLAKEKIMAAFHYVPLHSSPGGKKYARFQGDMTITNDVSDRLVRLPLHYSLTNDEVILVSKTILRFFNI